MAQRFRTRPVEIEAARWTGNNLEEMIEWTENNFKIRGIDESSLNPSGWVAQVYDKLHFTWINVLIGQWIVRGAKGEFYPCDDETFHWKYEEVNG